MFANIRTNDFLRKSLILNFKSEHNMNTFCCRPTFLLFLYFYRLTFQMLNTQNASEVWSERISLMLLSFVILFLLLVSYVIVYNISSGCSKKSRYLVKHYDSTNTNSKPNYNQIITKKILKE